MGGDTSNEMLVARAKVAPEFDDAAKTQLEGKLRGQLASLREELPSSVVTVVETEDPLLYRNLIDRAGDPTPLAESEIRRVDELLDARESAALNALTQKETIQLQKFLDAYAMRGAIRGDLGHYEIGLATPGEPSFTIRQVTGGWQVELSDRITSQVREAKMLSVDTFPAALNAVDVMQTALNVLNEHWVAPQSDVKDAPFSYQSDSKSLVFGATTGSLTLLQVDLLSPDRPLLDVLNWLYRNRRDDRPNGKTLGLSQLDEDYSGRGTYTSDAGEPDGKILYYGEWLNGVPSKAHFKSLKSGQEGDFLLNSDQKGLVNLNGKILPVEWDEKMRLLKFVEGPVQWPPFLTQTEAQHLGLIVGTLASVGYERIAPQSESNFAVRPLRTPQALSADAPLDVAPVALSVGGSAALEDAEKQGGEEQLTHEHEADESDDESLSPFDADLAQLMDEFGLEDAGDSKKNFAAVAKCLALESHEKCGAPAAIIFAQALLESGWGRSQGAQQDFIVFGIKAGKSYEGSAADYNTTEVIDGAEVEGPRRFRTYGSIRESFDAHAEYLKTAFPDACKNFGDDPRLFVEALQAVAGHQYATGENYVETIMDLAEKFEETPDSTEVSRSSQTDSSRPDENTPKPPAKPGMLSQVMDFFSHQWDKVKDFFKGIFAYFGWDVAKAVESQTAKAANQAATVETRAMQHTQKESAQNAAQLRGSRGEPVPPHQEIPSNWRELVNHPAAPVFSLGKGAPSLVTSFYGNRLDPVQREKGVNIQKTHWGIDLDSPVGTSVYATCSGTVLESRWDGGHGYILTVQPDGGGSPIKLCHLLAGALPVGTHFEPGMLLAHTGNTGYSTGPHLHVTAFKAGGNYTGKNKDYIDPIHYLPWDASEALQKDQQRRTADEERQTV